VRFMESRKSCRGVRWSVFIFFIGAFLLLASIAIPPVAAASGSFQEDFTTTTYRDGAVSNVTGWGTGEINIQREPLVHTDSVPVPGDAMYSVCVEGDIAYLAASFDGLQMVNVSDPYNGFSIGGIATDNLATGVEVVGNLAFVVDRTEGLYIFNISDPSNPSFVNRRTFHEHIYSVDIEGDYAYCGLNGEIQVVDISNPMAPTTAGATTDFYGGDSIFVSGNLIYSVYSSRFSIYNCTDPTNPTYVDHHTLPATGYKIFVSGNYAFIATGSGMLVYNVTNPLAAVLVGSIDLTSGASVKVVGDMAYIVDRVDGLIVIDVSDVTAPEILRRIDPYPSPIDVWVDGEYAYLAYSSAHDLSIVQIANTKSPTIEGNHDSYDEGYGVCVEGNYAFLADFLAGLTVFDITDPTMPTRVGFYLPPDYTFDVAVSGNYAFLACFSAGVVVVDISDPRNPSWVDTCNTPGYAFDVWIEGDYAYVADSSSGLQVIDISDPTDLTIVDTYNTPDDARYVCVEGNYAYVADYSSLHVLDITDPTSVAFADSYSMSICHSISIAGDYAYASAGNSGLLVLDISYPDSVELAGSIDTSEYVYHTAVQGDVVYLACLDDGFVTVDVTNPTSPSHIESITAGLNTTNDVFANGDYVYLADGPGGLKVVEVQQNLGRLFNDPGRAQSLPIFDSVVETVTSATLTPIHSTPAGTSIAYSLSADNGANWEMVTPGVEHDFTNTGKQLRWRAMLYTSDKLVAPSISNLTITYDTIMDPPILLSPSDTSSTGNDQPTFEWQSVSGATDYVIQIDIATTFDTVWLINETIGDVTYTPSSPLSDGTWYWRVASIDGDGDLGLFSSYWTLEIESTAPTWVETPENQDLEFGLDFNYDLNATDPSGISGWWLNDTVHFTIDINGAITNTVPLSVGDYGIQVWVNDTLNNIQTDEFAVTVEDTTAPTWDQIPTDQILECGEDFSYDLNATDLSSLGIWWLNDTVHFSVDGNGVINSNGVIPCGQYGVEVRAHDIYNNPCHGYFTVTVEDTLGPTWITPPTDQVLEFGESLDYQLQVTDPSGIDDYECDDTVHFTIDSTGRLANITPLAVGTYEITVTIYDPYDNELVGTFSIIVQEASTTTTSTTTDTTTSTNGDEQPMDMIFITLIVGVAVVALIAIICLVKSKSGGS